MNTEERHQNQPNELGKSISLVGHKLEEHATKIVAGVCALLLVAAAVTWWSRQSSASASKAWSRLENAQNVNDFGDVAEEFKGTPAGRFARLREAESYLQTGLQQMFSDREVAMTDLKKAREGFSELAEVKGLDRAILERALWGLAQSLEATCDGDCSKAIEAYQRLVSEVPDTFFKTLADQRAAELKTGAAKEFYAWFSKQNPKPTDQRPKDGSPISDELDSLMPKGKSEFEPDPTTSKPDAVKPTGDAEKPATSEKDEEKADQTSSKEGADSKPGTEEKPSPAKDSESKPTGDSEKKD